jgi:glycosyltransferase involved in cell wall biosynthesis
MMNWKGIRVAYRPYHKDCTVAGDRRRFAFYAKERNLSFEIADPSRQYDIVYLTYGCDLGRWITYKTANPGTRVIFELIDSYLLDGAGFFTFFRGAIRYISRKESRLYLNYKTALREMVSVCDAVVCSTPIQKEDISRYNKNIHISLDYFSNDIIQHKKSYSSNGKLKLVWEGQAYTVKNLFVINDVLNKLSEEIELHIITDPVIKYPFKVFNKKTSRLLKKLKCSYYIHDWTRPTFSQMVSEADLAIIPISSKQNIMWNKPENKLLLLWEMGIPVLTSDTPAYKRVMDKAGLDFYCRTPEEWIQKIKRYKEEGENERKRNASIASKYLQNYHSKDLILENWDTIFESVLD